MKKLKQISFPQEINKIISEDISNLFTDEDQDNFTEHGINPIFVNKLNKILKNHDDSPELKLDKFEAKTGSDFIIKTESMSFHAQAKKISLYAGNSNKIEVTLPKRKSSIDQILLDTLRRNKFNFTFEEIYATEIILKKSIWNQADLQIIKHLTGDKKTYPIFIFFCSPNLKKFSKRFNHLNHTILFASSFDLQDCAPKNSYILNPKKILFPPLKLMNSIYSHIGKKTFLRDVLVHNMKMNEEQTLINNLLGDGGFFGFTTEETESFNLQIENLKTTYPEAIKTAKSVLSHKIESIREEEVIIDFLHDSRIPGRRFTPFNYTINELREITKETKSKLINFINESYQEKMEQEFYMVDENSDDLVLDMGF